MRSYIPSVSIYEAIRTEHVVERLFDRFRENLVVDATAVSGLDDDLGRDIINSVAHAIIMRAKSVIGGSEPDTDYADVMLGKVIVKVGEKGYPVTLYVPKDLKNPPEPPPPGHAPENKDEYYDGNEVSLIYRPDKNTGEGAFLTAMVSWVDNRTRRSIPSDPMVVDIKTVAKTHLPKDMGRKELVLKPDSVMRTKPDGPMKILRDYDYANKQLSLYFDDRTRKIIEDKTWISFKSPMIRQDIWTVIQSLFDGIGKDDVMFTGKVYEWGMYDSAGKSKYEYESSGGKIKKPAPFIRIKIDDVTTKDGESARAKLQSLGESLWEKFAIMLCS